MMRLMLRLLFGFLPVRWKVNDAADAPALGAYEGVAMMPLMQSVFAVLASVH